MARCSFCDEIIAAGTGKMYIKTEGKILHFCGSKCEKNMIQLGRRGTHFKWTRSYKKARTAVGKVKKEA